jgi:hypothetical protein
VRPHVRIIEKIRNKLQNVLKLRLGARFGPDILNALNSATIDDKIRTLMGKDKIHILDQSGKAVYNVQMKAAAQKAAEEVEPQISDDEEAEDDGECVSPGLKTKKTVKVADGAMLDLEKQVKDHVRRNSKLTNIQF